jgi:hypothetical protein
MAKPSVLPLAYRCATLQKELMVDKMAPTSGEFGVRGLRSGPCSVWGDSAAPIVYGTPLQQSELFVNQM